MRIAYIVYSTEGPFSFADTEHDELLHFLQQQGLDIHKEAWADKSVQWEQYHCIVLKSPWDYVEKPQVFYAWLDKMTALNIALLNPADVVQWNCDKHYLQDIADAGLKVIPTAFIEKGEQFNPSVYFTAFGTGKIIVKPCISGSSKNTFLLSEDDIENKSVIGQLLQREAMMVQPFIPRIQEEGEWSLVFFGGKYSHALVKKPTSGDFRCQLQFGGSVHGMHPSPEVLQPATEYVVRFAKECLYARVDGLIIDRVFHLMELELVDPYLYLSTHAGATENYYGALQSALASHRFLHSRGSLSS
ncbi:MAG TPA: hypothetical protein VD993_20400 [Chitinophagaceae bacterium]|nr:hypothetical protein [Chitinophagaceae bacterium]